MSRSKQNLENFVNRYRRLVARFCLLVVLILFDAAGTSAADRLNLGYSTAGSVATAPMWITQDIGAFKKYGFEVTPIYLAGGLAPVALISGEIQFAIMSAGVTLPPAIKGADLAMIAGLSNYISHTLIVAPEITEANLLKGKRIAIQRLGDLTHIAAREAVKYAGLADSDVVYQQIGATPTRFTALQSGNVQAAVLSPPYPSRARKLGFRILVNLYDKKIPFISLGLVTTRRYIANQRSTVLNLLKAFGEGISFFKREREASSRIIERYTAGVPPEERAEAMDHYRNDLEDPPYPRPAGLKIALDLISQQSPVAKGVDPESFIDASLLRELERTKFFPVPTGSR